MRQSDARRPSWESPEVTFFGLYPLKVKLEASVMIPGSPEAFLLVQTWLFGSLPFLLTLHPFIAAVFFKSFNLSGFVKAHQAKQFKRSQTDSGGVHLRHDAIRHTKKPGDYKLLTQSGQISLANGFHHPSAQTVCLIKTAAQSWCELLLIFIGQRSRLGDTRG